MMKALLTACTGSSTQGEPKVIGIRKPPSAPTAPTIPSTAEASLTAFDSAAIRAGEPAAPAFLALTFQIAGIIRYADPLPMPVATNTARKASRNHGKMSELWFTAATICGENPGKLDGSFAHAASFSGGAVG